MVMHIECVLGSEITSSAVAHMAISTAPRHLLNASHYGDYFDASLGEGSARVEGTGAPPTGAAVGEEA